MAISNINRIDKSSSLPKGDAARLEDGPGRPEELFGAETFEKLQPTALTLSNGNTAALSSSLGPDQSAAVEGFLSTLSAEQATALHSQAASMTSEIQSTVASGGDVQSLVSSMAAAGNETVEAILVESSGIDEKEFHSATTSVMAMGMGQIEEKLVGLAMGVKGSNEAKNDIRTTLTELREELKDEAAVWPMEFTWNEYTVNKDNTLTITEQTKVLTKDEAALLEKKLSSKLDSLGENASLLQLNLQTALQQQTEITNVFTSILKTMNEAMMNIIRNAKA